jgi:hypothetical protein
MIGACTRSYDNHSYETTAKHIVQNKIRIMPDVHVVFILR